MEEEEDWRTEIVENKRSGLITDQEAEDLWCFNLWMQAGQPPKPWDDIYARVREEMKKAEG